MSCNDAMPPRRASTPLSATFIEESGAIVRMVPTVAIVCLLALAGCSSGNVDSRERTANPENTDSAPVPTETATPSIEGRYDVGGGRQLHLECLGEGTPVIVIDVGNDDTIHGSWDAVFTPMAGVSRVCAYDRANLGQSDADPGPRLLRDLADDLVTLLHVAEVHGPYVFVGGSFGGNIAAVLADQHPEQVAGLVLVDSEPANTDPNRDPWRSTLTAEQYRQCCAGGTGPPAFDSPENLEHIDYVGGLPEELHSVRHLPPVPTTVLTATRNDDCHANWPCSALVAAERRLQALWLSNNPLGRQVDVVSGHVMQREAPDAIVQETRAVVEAVRNP